MQSMGDVERDTAVLGWIDKRIKEYEQMIDKAEYEAAFSGIFHSKDAGKNAARLRRELAEFKRNVGLTEKSSKNGLTYC